MKKRTKEKRNRSHNEHPHANHPLLQHYLILRLIGGKSSLIFTLPTIFMRKFKALMQFWRHGMAGSWT
jgi:hypothetical protein